jgi:NAD(P)H-dependent FMN reductase
MKQNLVILSGSYRRGGLTEQAAGLIADAFVQNGGKVELIRLNDRRLDFCRNCRHCMRQLGPARGECIFKGDDLADVLQRLDAADAVVLASPVNAGDVTAVTRAFLERQAGSAYWPWGAPGPRPRPAPPPKPAVLLVSSAMPGPLARCFTHAMGTLRKLAATLNLRPVARLHLGLAATAPQVSLTARQSRHVRKAARRLIQATVASGATSRAVAA